MNPFFHAIAPAMCPGDSKRSPVRPYFSYQDRDLTINPGDPEWSLAQWREALVRGPGLEPQGRHLVVLHEEEPRQVGPIHIPQNAHIQAQYAIATVIALPQTIRVQRERLRSGPVMVENMGCYGVVDIPPPFRVGDQVIVPMFAGKWDLPGRLRVVDYLEVLAVLDP